MNVLKRFAKRCVALALCACCLGGAVVANVPVTAQAAVSVSASTPVIRLDTASCELNTTAQKYYLAVTVTPGPCEKGAPQLPSPSLFTVKSQTACVSTCSKGYGSPRKHINASLFSIL